MDSQAMPQTNETTHYNYDLQCWVTDGIIMDCGHPEDVKGCTACIFSGLEPVHATEILKTHS